MRKSGNDRHVASNQIDYKSMLECQRSTLEIIEDGMRLDRMDHACRLLFTLSNQVYCCLESVREIIDERGREYREKGVQEDKLDQIVSVKI